MAAVRQRPSPLRWWLTRLTIAVALGLVIAVVADYARGGITAIWLRYLGAGAYVARGERIEVQPGHALYIDCRGSGSPTLLLEAGMGSDSATWSPVFDELAAISRTCAYDRTGRGRSDGGSAGDLVGMSAELTALLAASGEPPPYVIVGHSLGTVIGRVHASLDPDVAGLVLVDGFDPDIFDDWIVPLLGPIREEYTRHTAGLWNLVSDVEAIDVERSRSQLAASDVSGRPIEVLLVPRADSRLSPAENVAVNRAFVDAYEALSPGNVTFTPAEGAGHMVQFDRPDLVVEAVRRLVAEVRGLG